MLPQSFDLPIVVDLEQLANRNECVHALLQAMLECRLEVVLENHIDTHLAQVLVHLCEKNWFISVILRTFDHIRHSVSFVLIKFN